ncbi:MAG TPA: Uma2 family endonuclease [Chloroflexota bacterium]|nr:Uma2 family endonuclease [Chloroflexota bacterium]
MSGPRVMTANWLHDDTEEDLVGADWHQRAIRSVVASVDDMAIEHGLPWHVGDQLPLVAAKPDGSVWRPSPDIMIHGRAGRAKRSEMTISDDGLPDLIIEVASPSTWSYDVDARAGKAWAYMHLGIPHYLVFDPFGDLLGEQCRGWRRTTDGVIAWEPDAAGRYQAASLDISFGPENDLLRAFDAAGRAIPFHFEQAGRIAELEARLARLLERG